MSSPRSSSPLKPVANGVALQLVATMRMTTALAKILTVLAIMILFFFGRRTCLWRKEVSDDNAQQGPIVAGHFSVAFKGSYGN